jgi:AcrR family transcriptional regulator
MSVTTSDEAAPKQPGRPRDAAARQKILDSALEILQEEGFSKVTCEMIRVRAGVSKATVYRWWPNKAAVMMEAFREAVAPEVPFSSTGSLENDIRAQLGKFVRMLKGPRGRILMAIVAAAQSDPVVAAALTDYWIKPRRAEAKAALSGNPQWKKSHIGVDPELVLDVLYGPLYFRLLIGLPLSDEYARSLADLVLNGLKG